MTLQGKLENFKSRPVGFHVKTEEIAWLLALAFNKCKLERYNELSHEFIMGVAWGKYGKTDGLYVAYNTAVTNGLAYGTTGGSGKTVEEIYEVTVEELEEYLGKAGE